MPSGELRLVPPGIGVTALPFRGKIKGEAACSGFEATYTLAKDTFLIDSPAVETRGCDEASQVIDEAFYQGLADTRKWSTRSSILTLRDEVDDVVMTLTRAKLPADPTIARWDLARLGAVDGSIAPIIQGAEPWMEFLRGGRLVGSTGCGSFVGSYTTNDSTMAIRDVNARLTECTEAVQQQAEQILATLAEITDFEVLPAGLVLEDAGRHDAPGPRAGHRPGPPHVDSVRDPGPGRRTSSSGRNASTHRRSGSRVASPTAVASAGASRAAVCARGWP